MISRTGGSILRNEQNVLAPGSQFAVWKTRTCTTPVKPQAMTEPENHTWPEYVQVTDDGRRVAVDLDKFTGFSLDQVWGAPVPLSPAIRDEIRARMFPVLFKLWASDFMPFSVYTPVLFLMMTGKRALPEAFAEDLDTEDASMDAKPEPDASPKERVHSACPAVLPITHVLRFYLQMWELFDNPALPTHEAWKTVIIKHQQRISDAAQSVQQIFNHGSSFEPLRAWLRGDTPTERPPEWRAIAAEWGRVVRGYTIVYTRSLEKSLLEFFNYSRDRWAEMQTSAAVPPESFCRDAGHVARVRAECRMLLRNRDRILEHTKIPDGVPRVRMILENEEDDAEPWPLDWGGGQLAHEALYNMALFTWTDGGRHDMQPLAADDLANVLGQLKLITKAETESAGK